MDKNTNDEIKNEKTKDKLDEMRALAQDSEKCREIAQKLQAYLSKNRKNG